jgi:inner membrane protein
LWNDPRFAPFRRFAVYPAVSRIESLGGSTCVWYTDLRYDLPALPDTFRYGFCRDGADASWELYRLRYFSERSRQRLSP